MACAIGADVQAWDEAGRPVIGRRGELVVTQPMPSMPVGLWGDIDRQRLVETYYGYCPGVWRHGDWIELTERGTCVISGRSDATLNRGGVRRGTAEFYAVVEEHPAVADSLIVHVDATGQRPAGTLVLLVELQGGRRIDAALRGELSTLLRSQLSPRHVPDAIVQVPSVPRTVTGKKLEVPVKRYLQGDSLEQVADAGALLRPGAMREIATAVAALRADLER